MIFTATTFSHNNYLAAANFKFQKVKGPPIVTFPVLGLLQWLEIGCWLLQLKALAINCSTCRASQLSRWHLWYYLATPLPFQLYYSTTCNISTLKEWSWGAKATRPDLTANSLSLSLSFSSYCISLGVWFILQGGEENCSLKGAWDKWITTQTPSPLLNKTTQPSSWCLQPSLIMLLVQHKLGQGSRWVPSV